MNKFARLVKIVGACLPTRLPVGMTEFNAWSQDIIDTFEVGGIADNDSLKWALAGIIMALGPTKAYVPKLYFFLVLVKSASNQIASGFMYELKQKQAAEQLVEKQKSAEATATEAGALSAAQTQPA